MSEVRAHAASASAPAQATSHPQRAAHAARGAGGAVQRTDRQPCCRTQKARNDQLAVHRPVRARSPAAQRRRHLQQSRQRLAPTASSASARCSRTCSTRRCASPARSRLSSRSIRPGCRSGTGVAPVATARIFTQGNLQQVGARSNVAIKGRASFRFCCPTATPPTRATARSSSIARGRSSLRWAITLQPAITIPADALTVTIGGDGTVSVTQPNSSTPDAGRQHPARGLHQPRRAAGDRQQSVPGDRLVRSGTTGDPGTNGLGVVDQGFLETSNVSVTEELVDLITAQRAFEINSRAVQVSDEMLQRLANLG